MNELDWWIASQWEIFKIKEGKTGLEFNKTDKEGNVLTVDRTQKWNKLRAKTDLKEMYIVRYADDFKLFCRDYATAKKVVLSLSAGLLSILASVLGLLSVLMLFVEKDISTGIAGLLMAFAISPFGLPALAGWLLAKLDELNGSLRGFIMG